MAEPDSLERPRFFSSKLLRTEDLALEQQYFREKLRRHNRSLHGFGIVSGLKVTTDSGKIAVDAGMALDCQGNEVVIGTAQMVSAPASSDNGRTAYVNIRYTEDSSEPVATQGVAQDSMIKESFEIVVVQENTNRGHKHLRARWLACGEPHALTIAKLKHSAQGWRVDRRYRPPTMK
jgi:hypothetical protein